MVNLLFCNTVCQTVLSRSQVAAYLLLQKHGLVQSVLLSCQTLQLIQPHQTLHRRHGIHVHFQQDFHSEQLQTVNSIFQQKVMNGRYIVEYGSSQ